MKDSAEEVAWRNLRRELVARWTERDDLRDAALGATKDPYHAAARILVSRIEERSGLDDEEGD